MKEDTSTINFDKAKVTKLHEVYAQAVKGKKEQFTFENKKFHTQYAKYLLEYLDKRFK